MKKYIILICMILLAVSFSSAQQRIVIHNGNSIMYESSIEEIDSIKFRNASSVFNFKDGANMSIPISSIDSITFTDVTTDTSNYIIYIIYENDSVRIINPFEDQGIIVSTSQFNVTVAAGSGIENVEYNVSGTSTDGSLSISSDKSIILTFNNLSLTCQSGTPISITNDITTTIQLIGTNEISDTENGKSATLLSVGNLIFQGTGRLTISGYKKHTISSDKAIMVESGTFIIPQSASDGFHCEAFVMNGGFIDITLPQGDGIDAGGGRATINNGIIQITSNAADVKGIKSDDILTVNGGTITMDIAGAQSKGFSGKDDFVMNGGNISITTSGVTVLEALGSGYDPSYCTAIKTKGSVIINGGTLHIESQSNSDGGKGISADGNITVYDGNIVISTAGTGKIYTDENGAKDSYTSSCIKSDGNISLFAGVITCTSTGGGGKGISADGYLTIGIVNANNDDLILNVNTSGERFYVSGSGDDADYANPKAVKCEGNMYVHSGEITIRCTQSDEGGEGLESKDTMFISGGNIDIEAYDDCINASNHMVLSGGNIHCTSSGNDAIDCNGTLTISGGFIIANGDRQPEGGIDCDQSTFRMNGGVVIGTGGSTSTPTSNSSSQYSIIYNNATAGNAICIKNSNNEIILLFQLPTYSSSSSGGGQGGPGGGNSNSMTVLFSDPALIPGSYTLYYGGTISGGTTVNGYNTGGTYSGGSSKNVTISNKVTTIQ